MPDLNELSPVQQAVAQQAARTAIAKWKADAKEIFTSRNSGLVLAGEDLGGLVLGGGLDLVSRKVIQNYILKQRPDEAAEAFHNRFDYWTAGLSIGVGIVSWGGAVALSHGEMQIHPAKQVARVAGAAQLLLGVNRLVSNKCHVPA